MPDMISLGQMVTSPTNDVGDIDEYQIDIKSSGKYVLILGGTAEVLAGIWGPGADADDFEPGPSNGRLRVCGITSRGCRLLAPGTYYVRVTRKSPGQSTLLIRSWSFWDYVTINFYKSTC